MSYKLNPAEYTECFSIPSSVVDKHIKLAGATQLKILLIALKNAPIGINPEDISQKLHTKGLYAYTVQIHTRNTNLKVKEYSKTLQNPLNTSLLIAREGMKLFMQNYNWDLPLRSVGLRVINLKSENIAFQQDFFGTDKDDEKQEKIENSILNLREKFGNNSIKRGRNCENQ